MSAVHSDFHRAVKMSKIHLLDQSHAVSAPCINLPETVDNPAEIGTLRVVDLAIFLSK